MVCPGRGSDKGSSDPFHTANPFTNLSNIVSALTAIGQLDVYSLSRESIQRMRPAPTQSTNGDGGAASRPARDDRQFSYRFSMSYVKSLPEAQRPIEREVFGKWHGPHYMSKADDRPLSYTATETMAGYWVLWRAGLPQR